MRQMMVSLSLIALIVFMSGSGCSGSSGEEGLWTPPTQRSDAARTPASEPKNWSGSGEPDYNALSIAQQLAKLRPGQAPDVDVIRLAFSNSQIATRDSKGNFSYERGQGLAVDEWVPGFLSKSMARGIKVTLKTLLLDIQLGSKGVHGPLPATATVNPQIRQAFLDDLRRATELDESDMTGLRHMSHLIVMIGLNSENPYDLLDATVSENVELNALQVYLILHRLSAELVARSLQYQPAQLSFLNKVPKAFAYTAADTAPCHMTDTQGLWTDGIATGSGIILGGVVEWGGLTEVLEKMDFITDTQAEKFSKMGLYGNMLSNVAKLAATIWAFEARIKATPYPLERTKTKVAGKDGKVNARFYMNTGDPQFVNCLRPMFNAAGLDFSLPNDGPIAGSLVEWTIHTPVGSPDDVIETVGSDPLHGTTDDNGETEIRIRGKAQKKDLTGKQLLQVDRFVPIRATINLKNKNGTQDLIDLASGVGGIPALWNLPFELLNRMPFLYAADVKLKVTDWKELEGDLFDIHGTYIQPVLTDSLNANMRNISDEFQAKVEVKIKPDDLSTAEVLSYQDNSTQYKDEYESHVGFGEGCMGTQAPIGRFEAFTALPGEAKGLVFYMQAPAENARIAIMVPGIRRHRGWHYTSDQPSCQGVNDVAAHESEVGLSIEWDSRQLNQVGQTLKVDTRDPNTGTGWIYEITYVK